MVDYNTIISSTDKKVTLMQWLETLATEFGDAKITGIAFTNDGDTSLTFTFTLADGTIKSVTANAITLTEGEKVCIKELTERLFIANNSISFYSVVNFAGNVVYQSNEVHEGYSSFLGDEAHAGTETHKGIIKTNEIDSLDGNAVVRNSSGKSVYGNASQPSVIMGSGDRPTYSKSGSDLTGTELALKSDIDGFYAKDCAVYRMAGANIWTNELLIPTDCQYSNIYVGMYAGCVLISPYFDGGYYSYDNVVFEKNKTFNIRGYVSIDVYGMFMNMKYGKKITFRDGIFNGATLVANGMFVHSNFTTVAMPVGTKVYSAACMFAYMPNLTEIPALDLSPTSSIQHMTDFMAHSPSVKSIHCTHFKWSFDISSSTKFEEADLVEILNNLDPVSTTQTLTMGATNLAKLTDDDILIATGKGWALA